MEKLEFLKNSTDDEFWTVGIYKMGNEKDNNQADLKRNENKGSFANEKGQDHESKEYAKYIQMHLDSQ